MANNNNDMPVIGGAMDEVGPGFPLPPFMQESMKSTRRVVFNVPRHPEVAGVGNLRVHVEAVMENNNLNIEVNTEGTPKNDEEYRAVMSLYQQA